ncbi:MAG: hypothetical protein IJ368_05430 [Oscillospiraceae bacterium]|nr:hypothetical protein [Oscillospiraceae bacterium]
MMDDIINSIIDIDRGASKRLEDAEKEKLRIISEAKELEENMIREAVENSRQELERMKKKQQEDTDAKISAIEAEKIRRISEMKKSFDENSDRWSEEIFKAVISV